MTLFYLVLICIVAGAIWYIVRRTERRTGRKENNVLEYRTPLAFDECLDALNAPNKGDEFEYACPRLADGSFTLHFTLHRPTNQPVDTVYALRIDGGKQTVISLHFLSEAFGYKEPVFGLALLDAFMKAKLNATRTGANPAAEPTGE